MSKPDIKFWVHRDGLTGKFYATTNYSLALSDDINAAHVYRTLKGAKNQIKGRVEMYKYNLKMMEKWKNSHDRDTYFKDYWEDTKREGEEAQDRLKDPSGVAYIEIFEVTSIVTLKKVSYK